MLASNDALTLSEIAPDPDIPLEGRRRVVAFIVDDTSEAALRGGLAGLAEELEIRRGTVRHAVRFLEKEAGMLAMVVDIAGMDNAIAGLEDLARVCPPDVLMAVIGDNREIGFYRALTQELGVAEYLPKPLTRDSVQTVLWPRLSGETAPAVTRGGHVVAVCGAHGGAGATSISVNLAVDLASTTRGHVALLDLNLQDGAASVMLSVRAGPGLRTALEDSSRADALFIERTATTFDHRLRIIAADEALDTSLHVTEAGVQHVLSVLRQKFNYIVIDLPMPLPPAMRSVVALSRHVVVVFEPEIAGLRNACAIRTLVNATAGANRIFTVLNRADRKGGLSQQIIRRALDGKPDLVVPDLGGRMTEAVNLGIPAIRRVSALRRHLAPLLLEVTGTRTAYKRSRLGRLFRR